MAIKRSARLKFVKKYKSLTMEEGRDDYLFWMNAQNIFFQLPNLNNNIVWRLKWLPRTR